MNVPCENSTPNTSRRCRYACRSGPSRQGRRACAQARTAGSVIAWSPPSTTGGEAGGQHLADGRLDRGVRGPGRRGSTARRRSRPPAARRTRRRRPPGAGRADDAPRIARGAAGRRGGRRRGRPSARRRPRRRSPRARRGPRCTPRREREQAGVVGLLAVLRPALQRIDHGSIPVCRTLMVWNSGSLAPCRRAPLSASSRR